MYCMECGTELPEGADVCPKCGIRAEDVTSPKNVKDNDYSDIFVSSEEQQIMVIKGGYIKNILSGAGLSKEIGVITNKRLYYRGKNYSSSRSGKEDCTVDLQDITSTGFVYKSSIIDIIIAMVCLVGGLILEIVWDNPVLFMLLFLFGMFWVVAYYLSKRTIYIITYGGGSLGINVSFFGLDIIRTFNKNVHISKEACLKEYYQLGRGSN